VPKDDVYIKCAWTNGPQGLEGACPVLAVQGNWPLGVAPGRVTVTLPGDYVRANPAFMDSTMWHGLIGGDDRVLTGDEASIVEFRQLWIVRADPSQPRLEDSLVTIEATDRRVFWSGRPSYGPRRYNIEYNGERAKASTITGPASGRSDNPRYPMHLYRTVSQILGEIFDWLGVPRDDVDLNNAGGGMLNLYSAGGMAFTQKSYAEPGVTVSIADDAPEWICPAGMTAVEALQKLEGLYGIRVALAPDGRVGFVGAPDLPGNIARHDAVLQALAAAGATDGSDPVRSMSKGYERDTLPDCVEILGSPVVMEDLMPLEPVIRDPDRPNCFLPLFRFTTLLALGIGNAARPFLAGKDGEVLIRFCIAQATAAIPWACIHPRLRPIALEAFRLWRVAMPLEGGTDVSLPDPPEARVKAGQIIDEADPSTGRRWRRRVAPRYRLKRDNTQGGQPPVAVSMPGGRVVSVPSPVVGEAQPHRVLPLLTHRAETTEDGGWAKPRLYGLNAVVVRKGQRNAGSRTVDWVDINFLPGYQDVEVEPPVSAAADLGIEPRIIDPHQGIIDTGELVIGSDGRMGTGNVRRSRPPVAMETDDNGNPTGLVPPEEGGLGQVGLGLTPIGPRSLLVHMLDGFMMQGRGATIADLYRHEQQTEGQETMPAGTPFLWLLCGYTKQSHGDLRDWTAGFSRTIRARSDPILDAPAAGAQTRLVLPPFAALSYTTGGVLRGLAPTQGGGVAHSLVIQTLAMPDLQLRCRTNRRGELTAAEAAAGGVPRPGPNLFVRQGGWRSGKMDGVMHFRDVTLKADVPTERALLEGEYEPITGTHCRALVTAMEGVVEALDSHIRAYRLNPDSIRVINADVLGWLRRYFPGCRLFAEAPVDNAAFSLTAHPQDASTRIAVNARAYRPYVGSSTARELGLAAFLRATTGAFGHLFGGGGSGGGGNSGTGMGSQSRAGQTAVEGAAPVVDHAHTSYPAPGIGGQPRAHVDRRDQVSAGTSGGNLDQGHGELVHIEPISGEIMAKREGGEIYLAAPGDWRDIILEPIKGDDGRRYHVQLDGLTNMYGAAAREEYSSQVGSTYGTAHLSPEPFPILPARMLGPPHLKRHGDISIIIGRHWFKRQPTANDHAGGGGIMRTRAPIVTTSPDGTVTKSDRSEKVAATTRDTITYQDTEPLLIEQEGLSTPGPQPMIRGPNWCSILVMFHEHLQLNAEGNSLLNGAMVPSPFGGVLNTATVREYLDLNPQAGGPLISTGSFCQLIPMTGGSAPHVNLNGYSYHVGIALLAEYVESYLGGNTLANIIDNIYATHAYCKALAKAVKVLWCILQTKLNVDDEGDAIGELRAEGRTVLPTICETVCVEEPEISGAPPPPPPEEDGAPSIGGP